MVDITEISAVVAAAGVLVGVLYSRYEATDNNKKNRPNGHII
jgi:hypothetical protein